jgi:hypothetical protein
MVSAGQSTRTCDAQVAVAFPVKPGMPDAASAAVALAAVAGASTPPCGREHGRR